MKTVYIYGLRDGDGEYFYIGQTVSIANRRAYHKTFPVKECQNMQMDILAEVKPEYASRIEKLFIDYYEATGCKLENKDRILYHTSDSFTDLADFQKQTGFTDEQVMNLLGWSMLCLPRVQSFISNGVRRKLQKVLNERQAAANVKVFLSL